jgi:hypothetical protein
MPLDLRHDTTRFVPALRPIAEAGEVPAHLVRRSPDRALQQVSGSQRAPLDIVKLVEHEQRVTAHAAEVAVIGAAFLFAVGRAFTQIHVENDDSRRSPLVHLVDPLAGQIGESGKVLGLAQPLRLEPAHLAGRGG